ncbi:MAG TPA: DUF2333 family protein [bacterium]|nr:DUF2333 family protein [bacterium]
MRKTLVLLVVLVLLGAYGTLAFLMSGKPDVPDVVAVDGQPSGYATVTMIHDLMQKQLDGFGGWLPNDTPLSPGWALDNLPNFQLGVLQVERHAARVLRDNLSRQRTSDAVHKEADLAFTAFANDPMKWVFPSAENRFRAGNKALVAFRADLGGNANFYPRADNLIQLLDPFMSELGAVTTLLAKSRDAQDVGWFQTDNNFYYAQGVAYAMLGIMKAVKYDFRGVLQDKNAMEITDQIIHALQQSQFEPWVVTNGRKDGILANHSNNLKTFLDDSRQKMYSLVTILTKG